MDLLLLVRLTLAWVIFKWPFEHNLCTFQDFQVEVLNIFARVEKNNNPSGKGAQEPIFRKWYRSDQQRHLRHESGKRPLKKLDIYQAREMGR